jgi:hypothetical protein
VKVACGTLAGFTIQAFSSQFFHKTKNFFNHGNPIPIFARPAACGPIHPHVVFLQKGSSSTGQYNYW